ncbi:MAG: protein jag [Clostridiales bacterium]|nr:protein jag [Clostridiales bacterium]
MRSIKSSAKTMEEAVTLGLEKLGVSFADVKIDIIDEGSKGFLGIIGGKPVVVNLTVRDDAEETDVLSEMALNEATQDHSLKKTAAPRAKQAAKPAREKVAKKVEKAVPVQKEQQKPKQKVQPKPVKAEAVQPDKVAAKPAMQSVTVPTDPVVICDPATPEGKAQKFMMDVTRLMGVDVSVYAKRDAEGNVRIDMFGDTLGILIGRRGETLDALQYLTSLNVNRGQEGYTRVTLDTENYRAKREEALSRLANRMANRAVKTGRKVVMEPMNPYERRILHSALQQNNNVTTHSEGEEPNRHVVITLKQ